MSFAIWKFHLDPPGISGRCTVAMPRNRTFLGVGAQDGRLVLWAMVDPSSSTEDVQFWAIGTGWTVPPEAVHYRGTVQMLNALVWHVFESAP